MAILNLSQAGRLLGYKTPWKLRRMLQRGELRDYLRTGPDNRCHYIETEPEGLPSLKEHVQTMTRPHLLSPVWCGESLATASDEVLEEAMAPINEWIESRESSWAERANAYLDLKAWCAPPWTAEQWQTLRVVIELATDSPS